MSHQAPAESTKKASRGPATLNCDELNHEDGFDIESIQTPKEAQSVHGKNKVATHDVKEEPLRKCLTSKYSQKKSVRFPDVKEHTHEESRNPDLAGSTLPNKVSMRPQTAKESYTNLGERLSASSQMSKPNAMFCDDWLEEVQNVENLLKSSRTSARDLFIESEEPNMLDEAMNSSKQLNVTKSERNIRNNGNRRDSNELDPNTFNSLVQSEFFDPEDPILQQLEKSKAEEPQNSTIARLASVWSVVNPSRKPSFPIKQSLQPIIEESGSPYKSPDSQEASNIFMMSEAFKSIPVQNVSDLKAAQFESKFNPPADPNDQTISGLTFGDRAADSSFEKKSMAAVVSKSISESIEIPVVEERDSATVHDVSLSKAALKRRRVAKGKPIQVWMATLQKVWPCTIRNDKGFVWNEDTKQIEVQDGDKVELSCKDISLSTVGVCGKPNYFKIPDALANMVEFEVKSHTGKKYLISTRHPSMINESNCEVFDHHSQTMGRGLLKFESTRVGGIFVKPNWDNVECVASINIKRRECTIWQLCERPKQRKIKDVYQTELWEGLSSVTYVLESDSNYPPEMLFIPISLRYPEPSPLLDCTRCVLSMDHRPAFYGELKVECDGSLKEVQFWFDWSAIGSEKWFDDQATDKPLKEEKNINRPRYIIVKFDFTDGTQLRDLHQKVRNWIYETQLARKNKSRPFKNWEEVEEIDYEPSYSKDTPTSKDMHSSNKKFTSSKIKLDADEDSIILRDQQKRVSTSSFEPHVRGVGRRVQKLQNLAASRIQIYFRYYLSKDQLRANTSDLVISKRKIRNADLKWKDFWQYWTENSKRFKTWKECARRFIILCKV